MSIHPQAAVSPYALVGANVKIGPFCVVEPGVIIGDNSMLASRVVVKSGTTLGRGNHICEGAVLGGLPQHIHMPESPGRLTIGDGNVDSRKRDDPPGDGREQVDDRSAASACLWSARTSPTTAHLGDHVIMTNNSLLGGHVHVEDRAYISGARCRPPVLPHRPAGDGRRTGARAARRAAVRHGRWRLDDGRGAQPRWIASGRLHCRANGTDQELRTS